MSMGRIKHRGRTPRHPSRRASNPNMGERQNPDHLKAKFACHGRKGALGGRVVDGLRKRGEK